MIFLPNNFERYTAALRNYIHISSLKHGILPKHIKSMKKIYETEALFSCNEKMPVNINLFANTLFLAAYAKLLKNNCSFRFSVFSDSNFMLNEKLFEVLLLNLCRTTRKISVTCSKNKIIIKSDNIPKLHHKILKALDAVYFFDVKTKNLIISITAEATDKKALQIKREWDILNPFSTINTFLFQQK